MLGRRLLAACAASALFFAGANASAQGDEPDAALRRPDCLTAGVAAQLLGQLAPDGRTLYFISTRHTTHELFAQDVEQGRGHLLFDEDADVTWPRVSPDGKAIAYISFRDHADGRLCIRNLPSGGSRRCLDEDFPAMQAEWIDSSRIALLVRTSIDGGLSMRQVDAGSLRARPLLERDLTSPAISADGRWLAYVPVERYAPSIGLAFAARAGQHLEIAGLDRPGAPTPIDVNLPGKTGQPAFARDGRFLYFVQFFSDTNHDGVIDARDHGVLFRAPISLGSTVHVGAPEQLTDASWGCEYPAPARDRLIATCARDNHNLDVYSLPLDGEVPSEWSALRLGEELELATTRADEQLLYSRKLTKETTTNARRLVMAALVRLHLELDEFRAAAFYAKRLSELRDPATSGMERPLLALVEQRRALRERERGRLSEDFDAEEHKRLDELHEQAGDSAATVAMVHIVRSEIADAGGDKKRARTELESARLDDSTPRAVIEYFHARADALYRELDDRAALVEVCRRLSASKALDLESRLEYARAAVRTMTRGLSYDAADATLARERTSAQSDSELAFAIDLGRATLAIRDARPAASVRAALLALYSQQTRDDRRRAVVYDAVQRATAFDADKIIEALAPRYLADARPGSTEHRRAVRLFRNAFVGRANRRAAKGHIAEARADFDAVTEKTGSYQSLASSIELRLHAGETPAVIERDFESHASNQPAALRAFAKGYLAAAALPSLDGSALDRASTAALATVRAAWAALKGKAAARALVGEILQQQFLRTGDPDLAERANIHELIALDLAGNDARYRAMLLGNLGMLHTAVGNYRIALTYLEKRNAIPYLDDAASLGVRLAFARALFHVGRDEEAAHAADEALASVDRTSALAEYRMLTLDCAGLYNLAAAHYERALALYDRLVPLVDDPRDRSGEAKRNRIVLRLARAAAALGAAKPARSIDDLAFVDHALEANDARDILRWPHASADDVMSSYRLIVAGLRAHAFGALGDLEAQNVQLRARRAIYADRLARMQRPEYARSLSLVEAHLSENSAARNQPGLAGSWAAAALAHADTAHASANAKVDFPQLDILWLAAELGVFGRAPLTLPLAKLLEDARSALGEDGRPAARAYQRWFEVYSTLLHAK